MSTSRYENGAPLGPKQEVTPEITAAVIRAHQYAWNGTPSKVAVDDFVAILNQEFDVVLVERAKVRAVLSTLVHVAKPVLAMAATILDKNGLRL